MECISSESGKPLTDCPTRSGRCDVSDVQTDASWLGRVHLTGSIVAPKPSSPPSFWVGVMRTALLYRTGKMRLTAPQALLP